jgi:hypothetical protein
VVSPYARSDPTRTESQSFRGGYAILEGGVPATSDGTVGAGCQAQPKGDPLIVVGDREGPKISCWMLGALRSSTWTRSPLRRGKDRHEEGNSETGVLEISAIGLDCIGLSPNYGESVHTASTSCTSKESIRRCRSKTSLAPVRDFITGCWPTVWCATYRTELTALNDDLQ